MTFPRQHSLAEHARVSVLHAACADCILYTCFQQCSRYICCMALHEWHALSLPYAEGYGMYIYEGLSTFSDWTSIFWNQAFTIQTKLSIVIASWSIRRGHHQHRLNQVHFCEHIHKWPWHILVEVSECDLVQPVQAILSCWLPLRSTEQLPCEDNYQHCRCSLHGA